MALQLKGGKLYHLGWGKSTPSGVAPGAYPGLG
jgi:hypothetical protein